MQKRLVAIIATLALAVGFLPPPAMAANAAQPMASPQVERGELKERRTAHSKVFRTDRGLEYQLFLNPIHWQDSAGQWQDNRQHLPYQVTFSDDGEGQVEFRYQKGVMRFRAKGKEKPKPLKMTRKDQTVRLLDEAEGTEYIYEMGTHVLKETIILTQPPAGGELRFPIEVEGVELVHQADGSIAAVEPEGEVHWRIAAPNADDAAGGQAPWAVQRIDGTGIAAELVITVDPEWLNDPARSWPVAVDPTIVLETDAAAGLDTYVEKVTDGTCTGDLSYSYNAWPQSAQIRIGQESATCTHYQRVGLLKFNLNNLSPGGTIVRARLMLLPVTLGTTVQIRPVSREWTEREATWDHPWREQNPLLDLDAAVSSVTIGDRNWKEIDITPLVAEWYTGTRPNMGIALTTATGTTMTTGGATFYSSDSTAPNVQPHLIIEVEEDRTAPQLAIIAPQPGSTVTGPPSVSFDVADERLDRVNVYVDGHLEGLWEGSAPDAKRAVLTPVGGLEAGAHQVEVWARDEAGNETVRRTDFTLAATAIPGDIAAMGIGAGKVQVAWTPVTGSQISYNVYRTTSPGGGNKVRANQSPVQGSSYVDTPPTPEGVYYYTVTTVDPLSGGESEFSRPVVAAAKSAPSLMLRFTDSGMNPQAPVPALREGAYSPDFPLVPTAPVWRKQTQAHEALTKLDAGQYTTQAGNGLVAGHLIRFDVLGSLNHYRQLAGLGPVDGTDISQLVASVRAGWSGGASGSSAGTLANGARIRIWNASQRVYAQPRMHAAAGGELSAEEIGALAGQYLDAKGELALLTEALYPTVGTIRSTLSSDFAELLVTFDNLAPSYLSATPMGSGQVLLTWEPSALGYRVHRSTDSTFVADESNRISDEIGVSRYVDGTANGLEAGTPYYYRVTTRPPSTGMLSSAAVSATVETNPAVWVTPTTASLTCSRADWAVNITPDGVAASSSLDGEMAVSQCEYFGSSNTARQEYQFDLLTAVKRQLGLSLTGTELKSRIEGMYVDWVGYSEGTSGSARLIIRNAGGSTLSTLATATQLTSPQRIVVEVPSFESFITAISSSAYAYVRVDGWFSPSVLKTDFIRVGVILRPLAGSATVTAGISPEGNVNLTWGGSGLFHVYRRTGTSPYLRVTTVPVMTSFVDTAVMTGQSYTYLIRSVDSTGAEGEPAATPVSVAVPALRVEEGNLTYSPASGAWTLSSSNYAYSGTRVMSSSSTPNPSHTVSHTFTGSGMTYIAMVGQFGEADVYLDGVHQGAVSLNRSTSLYQQPVFTKTDLPYGSHTFQLAYKGPVSTRSTINIDALDIHRDIAPPTSAIATADGHQVTLKWGAVPSADGYHIYRLVSGSDRYERVTPAKVTGVTQWTDHTVLTGPVTYVVTAIAPDGRESAPSAATEVLMDVGQYDGGYAAFTRNGKWTTQMEPVSYLRTLHVSEGPSSVSLRLAPGVGGFRVLGAIGPAYGNMEVYHNGVLRATVPLSASTEQFNRELYRQEEITGSTTVELRFSGTGSLDAIEVLPVDRPWFLTATAGSSGVTLSWTGTNAAAGGYNVKRANVSGGPYTTLTGTPILTTAFVDAAITPNSKYFYVVDGVRASGAATLPSNEASVTAGSRIGLDHRWPYVTVPGTTVTGYLHLSSGNLVLPVTDALIPSGPIAVVARRTYNSQDPVDRGLGRGWRLNVQQELEFAGATAVWTDGDGSRTILTRQVDGSYQGEAQTFVTLRQVAAGLWEITRKDGLRYRFSQQGSAWRMTATADRNGNEIQYLYDAAGSRVVSMKPLSGSTWSLEYDSITGLLTTITDGAGRIYRYQYDSGLLTRVTGAGGGVTAYEYAAGGELTAVTDPAGRTVRVEYAAGRVVAYVNGTGEKVSVAYYADRTEVTDPLQRTQGFHLNADGRLVKAVNGAGNSTAFEYDQAGNLTMVTDALNRVTTIASYDDWGNPGSITDALGSKTTITYHPTFHVPVIEIDPLGRMTEYAYDDMGNLTRTVKKGADGTTLSRVEYTYDSKGLRKTAVDPRAFADPAVLAGDAAARAKYSTSYEYDSGTGWLTAVVDPLGGTTTIAYDAAGNVMEQVDPLKRTTRYLYNPDGLLTSVRYPDGTEVRRAYDTAGYLVRQTDPAGAAVSYEYDEAGRPLTITDPLGGVTRFQYDAAGQQTAVVDARGNITRTQYDEVGRPVALTDPEGNTSRTAYDAVGNAIQIMLPNGYAITAEYDSLNRQVKVMEPPSVTETRYDAVGNPTLVRDANGRWTRYEFDGLNRLVRIYDALNVDNNGNPIASATYTSYEYDAAGNRMRVTDARQNQVTDPTQRKSIVYQYDLLNRVVHTVNQMNRSEYFTYDAAGQLTQTIDPNGTIKSYAYDLMGNLTAIGVGNTCESVRYEYDKAGRQVAASNGSGGVRYRYDLAGRLIEAIDPTGAATQYRYDPVGNVTAVTLREGTWQYSYDGANRLTEVIDPEGAKSSYSYTPDGRVASVSLPFGITLLNTYNSATNRLESQTYSSAVYSYEYDKKGNVTKSDGNSYQYDALDRLIKVSTGDPDAGVHYTYDAVGNRLSKYSTSDSGSVLTNTTETYSYDAANRILEVTRKGSVAERYVYDDAGRLMMVNRVNTSSGVSGGSRYEYDRFDRLVKESNGETITTYGYDANGHRLFRKTLPLPGVAAESLASQVYYQYALGQVVAERDGAGTAQAFVTRGLGGSLLTLHRPIDGKFVYITDRLGSVRQLINKDRRTINEYVYDEFGNVTTATGYLQNDWKFTGQILDAGTGLYHLSARYYNPNDGRFITQDTYKGSPWQPWTQNLYTYVGNNPVNYVDPTGHKPIEGAINAHGPDPKSYSAGCQALYWDEDQIAATVHTTAALERCAISAPDFMDAELTAAKFSSSVTTILTVPTGVGFEADVVDASFSLVPTYRTDKGTPILGLGLGVDQEIGGVEAAAGIVDVGLALGAEAYAAKTDLLGILRVGHIQITAAAETCSGCFGAMVKLGQETTLFGAFIEGLGVSIRFDWYE